ncbi:unnamed protein product [Aphanomyces euteiches]
MQDDNDTESRNNGGSHSDDDVINTNDPSVEGDKEEASFSNEEETKQDPHSSDEEETKDDAPFSQEYTVSEEADEPPQKHLRRSTNFFQPGTTFLTKISQGTRQGRVPRSRQYDDPSNLKKDANGLYYRAKITPESHEDWESLTQIDFIMRLRVQNGITQYFVRWYVDTPGYRKSEWADASDVPNATIALAELALYEAYTAAFQSDPSQFTEQKVKTFDEFLKSSSSWQSVGVNEDITCLLQAIRKASLLLQLPFQLSDEVYVQWFHNHKLDPKKAIPRSKLNNFLFIMTAKGFSVSQKHLGSNLVTQKLASPQETLASILKDAPFVVYLMITTFLDCAHTWTIHRRNRFVADIYDGISDKTINFEDIPDGVEIYRLLRLVPINVQTPRPKSVSVSTSNNLPSPQEEVISHLIKCNEYPLPSLGAVARQSRGLREFATEHGFADEANLLAPSLAGFLGGCNLEEGLVVES